MQQETLKSLSKSLGILKLFLNAKPELSISEISKLSGLNKPTSYRIAATLVKHGFLAQKERRGTYSLGLIYLSYYKAINIKLYFRNTIVPYLIKLSERVNEQIVIAYANGIDEPFPETFVGMGAQKHILNVTPKAGDKLPLNNTSVGKIILANLSEKEFQSYFASRVLTKTTPNTITDIQVMKDHLKVVKQENVAFDDEEYDLGIRSVAAGVRDMKGEIIASIAVFSPSVRLTYTKMQELSPIIRECALQISKELGFEG